MAFVFILCLTLSARMVGAEQSVSQEQVQIGANGQMIAARVPLEQNAVKGAPYSAEIIKESTQVLADGNRIVQRSTGRVYRDSEGRVRREEDHPSGSPSVSIIDSTAGVSYSLDAENHVAWRTPATVARQILEKLAAAGKDRQSISTLTWTSGDATAARDAEIARRRQEEELRMQKAEKVAAKVLGGPAALGSFNEQQAEEVLPARQMEGVEAQGHRRTTTIPAGAIGNDLPITIVSEEWTSLDLAVLVMTHRTDPRTGDSSYRLVNIVRSEPDASLFQVPSDYTVRETEFRRFDVTRREP